MTDQAPIGIISGSGMRSIASLTDVHEIEVDTPFGSPSAPVLNGRINGIPVAIMRRHGKGHHQLPSEINARANIAALKMQGVRQVLSLSAVGGLTELAAPGTFVVIDQFIDRTYLRQKTFFGGGIVAHVPFGDPVCADSLPLITGALERLGIPHLKSGTYLVMEGPQFSTRAESRFHQALGATVIGMTAMPEPKLCREAELCYNMIAMVTDFDCWHQGHEDVTADLVSARMAQNARAAEALLLEILPKLATRHAPCPSQCQNALDGAIMTELADISPARQAELGFLLNRVLSGAQAEITEQAH